MKLANFIFDTTDHASIMAAKIAPAAVGVGVSQVEAAQDNLVPLLQMPWADFAAMMSVIWVFLLIAEWVWKKAHAFIKWWKAREPA